MISDDGPGNSRTRTSARGGPKRGSRKLAGLVGLCLPMKWDGDCDCRFSMSRGAPRKCSGPGKLGLQAGTYHLSV